MLAGQTSENGLLAVLFSLTVIAMAVWLYGRYSGTRVQASARRIALCAAALALLALGLYVGWPQAAKASDISWEPWSAQRMAQLQQEGRRSTWTSPRAGAQPARPTRRLVFGSDKVRELLRRRNVALLKSDWTNSDPKITAELAKWNRSAVPFNLIYLPDAAAAKPLPEILTPSIVLEAFGAT